jgi:acyl-coenzyme A thioesterase PaaI-like protein
MTPTRFRWMLNLWPPFLFSGIRLLELAADYSACRVRLRVHWFNRNYVGTHFGGSLFAMTDPFIMLLAIQRLGRDYLVWDQAAEIQFIKAVREDVFAEFRLDDIVIAELRAATAAGERHLRWFDIDVRTASGELVARVRKQLYVKRKRRSTADSASTSS